MQKCKVFFLLNIFDKVCIIKKSLYICGINQIKNINMKNSSKKIKFYINEKQIEPPNNFQNPIIVHIGEVNELPSNTDDILKDYKGEIEINNWINEKN